MGRSLNDRKQLRIVCPNCTNFMTAFEDASGAVSGKCEICKAKIFSKWHKPKERIVTIKIA